MTRFDPGEVHLAGLSAGDEAQVRLPNTTRTIVATLLGVRAVSENTVAIYLDRLAHTPAIVTVGDYSVSGGYTTILTGPPPAHAS